MSSNKHKSNLCNVNKENYFFFFKKTTQRLSGEFLTHFCKKKKSFTKPTASIAYMLTYSDERLQVTSLTAAHNLGYTYKTQ